ncbi:MAG: flagellar protein FliT [Sulfuriflexus sp.]|nr:flagellar protein FliT [Sulfuriflexus sp.]
MSNRLHVQDIHWTRLQDMAGHMLDAAKESDWQRLIELNESRQPILESYFRDIAPTLDAELVRDKIYVLQAIEKQILQYSHAMRNDVATELRGLHRGKRVEQAYFTNSAA